MTDPKTSKLSTVFPLAAALFLLLIFVIVSFGGWFLSWQFRMPLARGGETRIIEVQKGWGIKQIAGELEKQGLIKNDLYFNLYIWQKGWEERLQAGTYELASSMSVADIAQKMKAGEILENVVTVTIPPGQKINRVAEILKQADFDTPPDISQFRVKDFSGEFAFLQGVPQNNTLEGFWYPETVTFRRDVTAEEITRRFLELFEKNIDKELRAEIEKRGWNLYDVLKLASIVEQEVPASKEQDRKIVAGIFWNRLEGNYPLESCVTIEYVLGVHKSRYSFEDTRTPSPYNTYINAGLPPTPIASPRRDAVEATVFFEPSDYQFFLSRPDTGQTIFSKTLQEHNQNVNKYLN